MRVEADLPLGGCARALENGGTRMLFVGVRRSPNRIAADVGLMGEVTRRLRFLDGWEGRAGQSLWLEVGIPLSMKVLWGHIHLISFSPLFAL